MRLTQCNSWIAFRISLSIYLIVVSPLRTQSSAGFPRSEKLERTYGQLNNWTYVQLHTGTLIEGQSFILHFLFPFAGCYPSVFSLLCSFTLLLLFDFFYTVVRLCLLMFSFYFPLMISFFLFPDTFPSTSFVLKSHLECRLQGFHRYRQASRTREIPVDSFC